jgi:type I restriction enzyme S subunit
MSWKIVELKDIAAKSKYPIGDGDHGAIKPSEYLDTGVPYIRVADMNWTGEISEEKMAYISEEVNNLNPKSHLFPGDIIISKTGATIGKVAIIPKKFKISNTTASIGKISINRELANERFVFWAMKAPDFQKEMWKVSHKSAQPGFNVDDLKHFKIPLPPLATQKRIAEILDAADALRRKDQELLKKYDEMAQAIFIEMFGDPVKNEKGWDVKKLDEVCLKITDGTHDTPERLTEGVKFITGKHIRPYFIDYQNSDYVTAEIHAEIYRRCNPEFGDVLYTNIGVNYATAAMNTVNYEFSMKNVALLKYNRELLTGRFLEYQLNNDYFKDRLKTITGIGGAQQFLSLAQIKSIKLLVPSLSLQLIFEEKINTLFTSVFKQKDSISLSINLFDSLIQKAFKGELVS